MIEVQNIIPVYEIDGQEVKFADPKLRPTIGVASHWNRMDLVVIKIGDKNYTVVAGDLITAIKNATNTNRY